MANKSTLPSRGQERFVDRTDHGNSEVDASLYSVEILDTIALTTSPTMESLDLYDTKSLDSLKLDPPCHVDEVMEDDMSIRIDEAKYDYATEVVPLSDTGAALQFGVDLSSEVAVTKSEPRICDYFASSSNDDAFNNIVPDCAMITSNDRSLVVESESEPKSESVAPTTDHDSNRRIAREEHKSGSTIVETSSCSFEGEPGSKYNICSVSDLLETQEGEKQEQFDMFTAEEGEEYTEDVKPTNTSVYVITHSLSPGPSPVTSEYASPLHHSLSAPIGIPPDVHLCTSANTDCPKDEFTYPFSASLTLDGDEHLPTSMKMSGTDRRDAWIPSDLTKMTFASMMANGPETFQPRQDQLTMPGLLLDERQGDPVVEMMLKCMNEQEVAKRQTLTAGMVSQDEVGLRILIKAECYRSALDLTSTLLTMHGQGAGKMNLYSKNTTETLQLWFVRICILMKLKLYHVAESELAPFANFDKDDMYYEFYSDVHHGRKGCMVPFSLRILHAELPSFLGRSLDSLDRLYYLYDVVKKILRNLEVGLCEDGSPLELPKEQLEKSLELWQKREVRLLYSIANIFIGAKIYDSAVESMMSLIQKDSENRIPLIATLGRLYLQMGDLKSAQRELDRLETLLDKDDDVAQSKLHMNRGFLALGTNYFEAAKECFQRVIELDPGNGVAVNNMAVCSLYTGKLRDAVHILESLVHTNPSRYIQDSIIINLCTLYELESSRALQKKQRLLQMVAEYKGNGFNVHCLKMGELMTKK